MEEVFKRLDATSGASAEFNLRSNASLIGKFVITGTAGAAIKIFEVKSERGEYSFFKVSCSNWSGATVALQLKTGHADDAFTTSGVVFSENSSQYSIVR